MKTTTSIRPRTFVAILAVLAVLVGVLLLFLPMSATVDGASYRCGSAVVSADGGFSYADMIAAAEQGAVVHPPAVRSACSDARDSRGTLAWTLVGVGVVVLAGARFVRWTGQPA